ncbi:MAG: hypothetical protein WC986_14565 [Elusimicrobiota bacterium]|jgi:hypothetical protein
MKPYLTALALALVAATPFAIISCTLGPVAPGAPAPKPTADWPAFPSTSISNRGMTYRQWLIGQALSGCIINHLALQSPAECAVANADAVIALEGK